jgi:hypothetical protein
MGHDTQVAHNFTESYCAVTKYANLQTHTPQKAQCPGNASDTSALLVPVSHKRPTVLPTQCCRPQIGSAACMSGSASVRLGQPRWGRGRIPVAGASIGRRRVTLHHPCWGFRPMTMKDRIVSCPMRVALERRPMRHAQRHGPARRRVLRGCSRVSAALLSRNNGGVGSI